MVKRKNGLKHLLQQEIRFVSGNYVFFTVLMAFKKIEIVLFTCLFLLQTILGTNDYFDVIAASRTPAEPKR